MKTTRVFFLILAIALTICPSTVTHGQQENARHEVPSTFEVLKAKADSGDAPSQLMLGKLYVDGDGVAKDEAEAANWFRKAAEQGNVGAQRRLGFCYMTGSGVAQDDIEAKMWYDMAKGKPAAEAKAAAAEAKARVQVEKEVQAKAAAEAKAAGEAKAAAEARAAAAEAQAREAQAQAELQAETNARAEQIRTIQFTGFMVVSLGISIFIFIKAKKASDAARSKKVAELSAKLLLLKADMDRENRDYENWSKNHPEAWKKIKTNLVDSYLASENGQILNEWDFGHSEMEMRLAFVRKEQAFLPPSARPSDEQWQAALKPKVEPEAELAKQRQTKIRDILLSRLAPDYETQQYDMDDLAVKFIDLDLERTDAIPEEPMSDEEVNKWMAATTELLKTMESPLLSDDELMALLKKIQTDELDYLGSTIATHSPALESRLKNLRKKYEKQLAYLQTKNEEELRVLKARHPEKFN